MCQCIGLNRLKVVQFFSICFFYPILCFSFLIHIYRLMLKVFPGIFLTDFFYKSGMQTCFVFGLMFSILFLDSFCNLAEHSQFGRMDFNKYGSYRSFSLFITSSVVMRLLCRF